LGKAPSPGYAVRCPAALGRTAVTLAEIAIAEGGTLHWPAIGKIEETPETSGEPAIRVSKMRHGGRLKKTLPGGAVLGVDPRTGTPRAGAAQTAVTKAAQPKARVRRTKRMRSPPKDHATAQMYWLAINYSEHTPTARA